MDANFIELVEKLVENYSSTTSDKTPHVIMFPSNAVNNDYCHINIYADLIPHIPHDYYMGVSYQNWRKHVEPVTNVQILTCETKEEAMNVLNIERELLLKQLWLQRECVQKLKRETMKEERNRRMKKAQLEEEIKCKERELAKCREALLVVKKQFCEYKEQHQHEPIEQPESESVYELSSRNE